MPQTWEAWFTATSRVFEQIASSIFHYSRGFAITTTAYEDFLSFNDLPSKIDKITGDKFTNNSGITEDQKKAIEEIFSEAVFPPALRKAIKQEIKNLQKKAKQKSLLAVRSSAVGEDSSGRSFAGQFLSLINVSKEQVYSAYKKVIASRFKHFEHEK